MYSYQLFAYRSPDFVEDIDIIEIKLSNPPEFFKAVAIAIGGGFLLIIAVYFGNMFVLK